MTNPAADVFDQWAREGKDAGMEEGHSDVVRQVMETMDVRAGDQILDLGCGNGWATRLLAQLAPAARRLALARHRTQCFRHSLHLLLSSWGAARGALACFTTCCSEGLGYVARLERVYVAEARGCRARQYW